MVGTLSAVSKQKIAIKKSNLTFFFPIGLCSVGQTHSKREPMFGLIRSLPTCQITEPSELSGAIENKVKKRRHALLL